MLKRFSLEPSRIALNLAVLLIIALWTFPTAGLLISSLRDKNDIAASGWWTALSSANELAELVRAVNQLSAASGGERVYLLLDKRGKR